MTAAEKVRDSYLNGAPLPEPFYIRIYSQVNFLSDATNSLDEIG
jgi:hypothetical protein